MRPNLKITRRRCALLIATQYLLAPSHTFMFFALGYDQAAAVGMSYKTAFECL